MTQTKEKDGVHVCQCECGGEVRGHEQFGRMFTWCEQCSPVTRMTTDDSDDTEGRRLYRARANGMAKASMGLTRKTKLVRK